VSNYVRETAAGKSIRAMIICKGARKVATVQVHYGSGGGVLVNIWQEPDAAKRSADARAKAGKPFKAEEYRSAGAFQQAKSGGYGYDKLTAALSGLIVDGHEMSDHCSRNGAPKPPKGAPCFPSDFKAPKGYTLANWGAYSRANPNAYFGPVGDWRDKAAAALGINRAECDGEGWNRICEKAAQMQAEWEESPDCVKGWKDCYRLSGLAYLSAKGYTIHDAI